jgi:hypothetical protein
MEDITMEKLVKYYLSDDIRKCLWKHGDLMESEISDEIIESKSQKSYNN